MQTDGYVLCPLSQVFKEPKATIHFTQAERRHTQTHTKSQQISPFSRAPINCDRSDEPLACTKAATIAPPRSLGCPLEAQLAPGSHGDGQLVGTRLGLQHRGLRQRVWDAKPSGGLHLSPFPSPTQLQHHHQLLRYNSNNLNTVQAPALGLTTYVVQPSVMPLILFTRNTHM